MDDRKRQAVRQDRIGVAEGVADGKEACGKRDVAGLDRIAQARHRQRR
jgi:hypothetical protein